MDTFLHSPTFLLADKDVINRSLPTFLLADKDVINRSLPTFLLADKDVINRSLPTFLLADKDVINRSLPLYTVSQSIRIVLLWQVSCLIPLSAYYDTIVASIDAHTQISYLYYCNEAPSVVGTTFTASEGNSLPMLPMKRWTPRFSRNELRRRTP